MYLIAWWHSDGSKDWEIVDGNDEKDMFIYELISDGVPDDEITVAELIDDPNDELLDTPI